ncbi:MAG: hypothetical protein KGL12_13150 [Rhodospirillales bacterium]|nr:hypothetical protein [Rhodospirillales bacterium]
MGIFSKSGLLTLLLALGACSAQGGPGGSLEGAWAGSLHADTASCPGGQRAQMHIGADGHFAIDPFASTLVIDGRQGSDGHFWGQLDRPDPAGHMLRLTFDAIATADHGTLIGTLASGPCRWSVSLHRS